MAASSEEWTPLPPRERKRSRRHGPLNTASPSSSDEPVSQATSHVGDNKAEPSTAVPPHREVDEGGGEASGDAGGEERRSSNMAKVEQAVEARAAIHRAERGGEDMGGDGLPGEFYEYLDHTADVQLHAWGPTLVAAMENLAPCMFNYMTDLKRVQVDDSKAVELEMEGHDLPSLLFAYLDELLYKFSTDSFICKKATITSFDREAFKIRVKGQGELFDLEKHPQGTEVKAITYSNMQIHEKDDRTDLYVIVDI